MISVKSYNVNIDKIRSLRSKVKSKKGKVRKRKRKIILNIKFLTFPNLENAELQIYPGSRNGSDGTKENMIPIDSTSAAPPLQSNTFVAGNSHILVKNIFPKTIKKGDKGYFIFTPVISKEHLVFDIRLQIEGRIDASDVFQSNPCPPAPPGFAKKKK